MIKTEIKEIAAVKPGAEKPVIVFVELSHDNPLDNDAGNERDRSVEHKRKDTPSCEQHELGRIVRCRGEERRRDYVGHKNNRQSIQKPSKHRQSE